MRNWKDVGIELKGEQGSFKTLCPKCSHTRKKNPSELCLSVDTELHGGCWNCWNCGWTGRLDYNSYTSKDSFNWSEKDYTIPKYNTDYWELSKEAVSWFKSRGISKETLEANMIGAGSMRFKGVDSEPESCVSFPFFKNDKIVNVQFRSIDNKAFKLTKGAEKPFYGFNHLIEDGHIATDKLIIVEGMMDKLALYESGVRFVLSVPNGSPFEQEGEDRKNPKLEYLDDPDFLYLIQNAKEVIFATDNDYQGMRLRDSIAERVGLEKSKIVSYPAGCKDMNDVLMNFGQEKVIDVLTQATPFPVTGIITVKDLERDLLSFYQEGLSSGKKVGIESLDSIFTLANPAIITVTGSPESLKTVFVDNLIVRYAEEYGIKSAVFSPESRPETFHISRLASIRNGYNFGSPNKKDRMPFEEFKKSYNWIDEHFAFLSPENNSLDEILSLAKTAIVQKGIKILVIDPFSKIAVDGQDTHGFVRNMFLKLNNFVHANKITVFLVAHPKKLELIGKERGEEDDGIRDYKVTQPYDIAESSHFYNSSDYILSLWRTKKVDDAPLRVYVQKSKLHHIAKSNKYTELWYDKSNWRLSDD